MTTLSLFAAPPLQTPPAPKPQAASPAPLAPSQAPAGITLDEVKRALPSHLRASASQDLVDQINTISSDPLVAADIRNNFVSYTAVLKDGKFKTEDYMNAVAYCSFKLMGHTNEEAYARTFPTRYAALVAKGSSKKDISAYVSAFSRGKLVNLVLEQTLVPTWVLNQDLYQKAINTQAELMMTASSEKVRTDAANSLLTHLKKPEVKEFQISMETESSGMKEMRDTLAQLAAQQRALIESGAMKTIDVAATRLVHKDVIDV